MTNLSGRFRPKAALANSEFNALKLTLNFEAALALCITKMWRMRPEGFVMETSGASTPFLWPLNRLIDQITLIFDRCSHVFLQYLQETLQVFA